MKRDSILFMMSLSFVLTVQALGSLAHAAETQGQLDQVDREICHRLYENKRLSVEEFLGCSMMLSTMKPASGHPSHPLAGAIDTQGAELKMPGVDPEYIQWLKSLDHQEP